MTLAFLFDLDLTLIDSSSAEQFRNSRNWNKAIAEIKNFKPYPSSESPHAHEIPGLLHEQGHKIGIITSSSRGYAEAVIKHFNIYTDVLVAYQDTTAHKPDPEPILAALKSLGKPASKAIYLGDSIADFQACSAANVYSIAAHWGMRSVLDVSGDMPDAFLTTPSGLLGNTSWALLAELVFSASALPATGGVVVKCDPIENIFTLGRYFQTGDSRHAAHKLSSSLIQLKNHDVETKKFAYSIHRFIKTLKVCPDSIVPVPPKPNQRNRFGPILIEVNALRSLEGLNQISIMNDGLQCISIIPGYKALGRSERSDRIQGTIDSKYTWNNGKVLIIDDVYTTGSTLRECIKILKESKAKNVTGVTFGKDQFIKSTKLCPTCGSTMRTRVAGGTGKKFWGCSSFPKCRTTCSI